MLYHLSSTLPIHYLNQQNISLSISLFSLYTTSSLTLLIHYLNQQYIIFLSISFFPWFVFDRCSHGQVTEELLHFLACRQSSRSHGRVGRWRRRIWKLKFTFFGRRSASGGLLLCRFGCGRGGCGSNRGGGGGNRWVGSSSGRCGGRSGGSGSGSGITST